MAIVSSVSSLQPMYRMCKLWSDVAYPDWSRVGCTRVTLTHTSLAVTPGALASTYALTMATVTVATLRPLSAATSSWLQVVVTQSPVQTETFADNRFSWIADCAGSSLSNNSSGTSLSSMLT